MKTERPAKNAPDLAHGGSASWWPPRGDHVILYKANPLRFEFFDRFLGDWKDVRVLDVGCGGGYACEFLAGRGAVVHGADLMAEALAEARRHAAEAGLSIAYRRCTEERLPFDDRSMDVVVCVDVLEHIPAKRRTLDEIFRVLKPGGWFFFDTFNRTFWSRLFVIWMGETMLRLIPRGTHHWPYFVRPEALTRLAQDAGFRNVQLGGIAWERRARRRHGVPLAATPGGNQTVLYFGAAEKPDPVQS